MQSWMWRFALCNAPSARDVPTLSRYVSSNQVGGFIREARGRCFFEAKSQMFESMPNTRNESTIGHAEVYCMFPMKSRTPERYGCGLLTPAPRDDGQRPVLLAAPAHAAPPSPRVRCDAGVKSHDATRTGMEACGPVGGDSLLWLQTAPGLW